ncbi:hypothetical protein ACH5RR_036674 [Cinchona calisaya]|uniref:Pentatricopeptide repeat-containing protein n=1 Tax=Cinchona calisaya TaxID=153742 RepID=A0ABD2Y8T4_9GENT
MYVCMSGGGASDEWLWQLATVTGAVSNLLLLSRAKGALIAAKTSSCSSASVLEENVSCTTTSPVIQLDLDHVSSLPETDDLNGLICALFEDSRTEELAYDYYERAKEKADFRPKKLTLKLTIRLISSCTRARKFKLVNTLLGIFSADESIAFLAFDAAMKSYNMLHMYSSTISLYERMKLL